MSGFDRDPTTPTPQPAPFPWWLFAVALASLAFGFGVVLWLVGLASKAINDNGVTP